jgi:glycosyltransferase involved in cell wall biosynthesis
MKKTWIVTFHFGKVKAGPVIRFIRYVPFFKQNGINTTFVTKKREEENSKNENGYESVFFECENMVQLTKKAILKAVRQKDRPDSLVFFSLEHAAYFYFLLAKLFGIRLVYVSTMQFDIKVKEYGKKRNFLSQFILAIILNRLFALMDSIVCSTNILRDDFVKIGVPEKKIKVIYNGVNIERFRPATLTEKTEIRKNLGINVDSLVFLYVGLFVERKGVDYLMDLWENFINKNPQADCKLLMVGDEMLNINENSAEFKENWPTIKQKSIDKGSVIFMPFSDNIEEYYQAADAFIFMSRLEGMPNVLLESMASGLPILVNKFKGFSSDYGVDGMEYLLMTNVLGKDLEKLENVVFSKSQREELSTNARSHAINKFDFNKSIMSFCEVLG